MTMSVRAYARHRGCSHTTIRRHVSAGVIKLHKGKVNPVQADAALAAKLTRGADLPVSLTEARKRKLCAQIALLHDEVSELAASSVSPSVASELWLAEARAIWWRWGALVDVAPAIAGLPSAEAEALARDRVNDILAALVDRAGEGDPEAAEMVELPPVVDDLDEAGLSALKVSLEARRLELRRAINQGALIAVEQVGVEFERALFDVRSAMLALPVRLAVDAPTTSADELAAAIEAGLREACRQLAAPDRATADEILVSEPEPGPKPPRRAGGRRSRKA